MLIPRCSIAKSLSDVPPTAVPAGEALSPAIRLIAVLPCEACDRLRRCAWPEFLALQRRELHDRRDARQLGVPHEVPVDPPWRPARGVRSDGTGRRDDPVDGHVVG